MENKLLKDIALQDNIICGISFEELITTCRCNGVKQPALIKREFREIMHKNLIDADYLINSNMEKIIELIKQE